MNANIKTAVRFKSLVVKKFPVRIHMFIILSAVITFGLVLSRICLHAGLTNMAVRYTVILTASYAFFFVAIRVWLFYVLPSINRKNSSLNTSSSGLDLPSSFDIPSPSGAAEKLPSGGGGTFSGAGAGGNWDRGIASAVNQEINSPAAVMPVTSPVSQGSSDGFLSLGDLDIDSAGALAILLIFIIIAAMFGGAVYLIYQAPAILSEAAFNALLSGSMVRASKQMRSDDWAGSVFRATWIPFTVIAVITISAAVVLVTYFPGETNLGDIVRHYVLK